MKESLCVCFSAPANDDISSYHNNVMHKINLAPFFFSVDLNSSFSSFLVFCSLTLGARNTPNTLDTTILSVRMLFDDDTPRLMHKCGSFVDSALVAKCTLHVCNTRFHSFLRIHSHQLALDANKCFSFSKKSCSLSALTIISAVVFHLLFSSFIE